MSLANLKDFPALTSTNNISGGGPGLGNSNPRKSSMDLDPSLFDDFDAPTPATGPGNRNTQTTVTTTTNQDPPYIPLNPNVNAPPPLKMSAAAQEEKRRKELAANFGITGPTSSQQPTTATGGLGAPGKKRDALDDFLPYGQRPQTEEEKALEEELERQNKTLLAEIERKQQVVGGGMGGGMGDDNDFDKSSDDELGPGGQNFNPGLRSSNAMNKMNNNYQSQTASGTLTQQQNPIQESDDDSDMDDLLNDIIDDDQTKAKIGIKSRETRKKEQQMAAAAMQQQQQQNAPPGPPRRASTGNIELEEKFNGNNLNFKGPGQSMNLNHTAGPSLLGGNNNNLNPTPDLNNNNVLNTTTGSQLNITQKELNFNTSIGSGLGVSGGGVGGLTGLTGLGSSSTQQQTQVVTNPLTNPVLATGNPIQQNITQSQPAVGRRPRAEPERKSKVLEVNDSDDDFFLPGMGDSDNDDDDNDVGGGKRKDSKDKESDKQKDNQRENLNDSKDSSSKDFKFDKELKEGKKNKMSNDLGLDNVLGLNDDDIPAFGTQNKKKNDNIDLKKISQSQPVQKLQAGTSRKIVNTNISDNSSDSDSSPGELFGRKKGNITATIAPGSGNISNPRRNSVGGTSASNTNRDNLNQNGNLNNLNNLNSNLNLLNSSNKNSSNLSNTINSNVMNNLSNLNNTNGSNGIGGALGGQTSHNSTSTSQSQSQLQSNHNASKDRQTQNAAASVVANLGAVLGGGTSNVANVVGGGGGGGLSGLAGLGVGLTGLNNQNQGNNNGIGTILNTNQNLNLNSDFSNVNSDFVNSLKNDLSTAQTTIMSLENKLRRAENEVKETESRWQQRFDRLKMDTDAEKERYTLEKTRMENDIERLKQQQLEELRHLHESKRMMSESLDLEKESCRRDEQRKHREEVEAVRRKLLDEQSQAEKRHTRQIAVIRESTEKEIESVKRSFTSGVQLNNLLERVHDTTFQMDQISKKLEVTRTAEDQVREQALNAREGQIREQEAKIHDERKEFELQRQKLSELITRMETELSDGKAQTRRANERLDREHARILELERSLRQEKLQLSEQSSKIKDEQEEEKRIVMKRLMEQEEDIKGREREIQAKEQSLKKVETKIEQARLNCDRRIRESESLISVERRNLIGEIERFEEKRKVLLEKEEKLNSGEKQLNAEREKLEYESEDLKNLAEKIEERRKNVEQMLSENLEIRSQIERAKSQMLADRSIRENEVNRLKSLQLMIEHQRLALVHDTGNSNNAGVVSGNNNGMRNGGPGSAPHPNQQDFQSLANAMNQNQHNQLQLAMDVVSRTGTSGAALPPPLPNNNNNNNNNGPTVSLPREVSSKGSVATIDTYSHSNRMDVEMKNTDRLLSLSRVAVDRNQLKSQLDSWKHASQQTQQHISAMQGEFLEKIVAGNMPGNSFLQSQNITSDSQKLSQSLIQFKGNGQGPTVVYDTNNNNLNTSNLNQQQQLGLKNHINDHDLKLPSPKCLALESGAWSSLTSQSQTNHSNSANSINSQNQTINSQTQSNVNLNVSGLISASLNTLEPLSTGPMKGKKESGIREILEN